MQKRVYNLASLSDHISAPNVWDIVALAFILGFLGALAWFASQVTLPYQVGQQLPITLAPSALPGYALRTVVRMAIAMMLSLLFTFTVGTMAAKSAHAEHFIIPVIDILQSVPILGFLSITIIGFIQLFKGSILGPECACVFVIFTSQAWNMTLSFYQSLRTVPENLHEAARMFHLTAWQKFWRIEVPFAMPGLLWNAMMSMSGGWFFVVASEAISVSNQHITLPGIGSYISLAILHRDIHAVLYSIATMFIVILLYDQLIFRPLLAWSEKFKMIQDAPDEETYESWLTDMVQRTRWMRKVFNGIGTLTEKFINLGSGMKHDYLKPKKALNQHQQKYINVAWNTLLVGILVVSSLFLMAFVHQSLSYHEIRYVFWLGLVTGLKVAVLIIVCSIVWVPVGVWIGRHPKWMKVAQPLVQIFAAFPVNLVFPVVVIGIVTFHLNVNVWTAPLLVLGAQWYILFNVIAGASMLPKDLYQVTANFGVKGWLWWRKFILPGIFPYYVTGVMTAAGGAWNASILAEYVSWGHTTLKAVGLGAYITEYTSVGNFPHIALGIAVMCFYTLLTNRLVWQPLYRLAESRFMIL